MPPSGPLRTGTGNELAPEAIDRAASAENRIGQLLDLAQGQAVGHLRRTLGQPHALQPHRPVASFIQAFAGETIRSRTAREDH
jgi:hypothetical protein